MMRARFFFSVFLSVLLGVFAGCRARVERVEWTTMGTVAALQWRGDGEAREALARIKETFSEIETLLNAHRETSEISRLAPLREDDILARCSPLVKPCYQFAFDFSRATKGAFDPRWRGPATLDFGAIAKGFALDVARARLSEHGLETAPDLLIDLGGSLYAVKGDWRVAVAKADQSFVLKEGDACATSATYFRGTHICDARTHTPVTNDLLSVTVVTQGDAMLADALSTTLFILEGEETDSFLAPYRACLRAISRIRKEK